MKLPRRNFLHLAASAAALPVVSRVARGQTYPSRPVRIMVGCPAGCAADAVARLIAHSLSESLRQQFVVESRPGAGSTIAADAVVRATPDGYSLLLVTQTNAINATFYENLGFDFIRDIAPVASIVVAHFVMAVSPSVPAKTVPEFIDYAKANPGKVNMPSPGTGSAGHVFGELFKIMTGVHMVHVPYRATFIPDLLSGQVQVAFATIGALIEHIRNWQATRPCGDRGDARGPTARCPRLGRICVRLRGERLDRHRRAQEHICRDHRNSQQGDYRRSH